MSESRFKYAWADSEVELLEPRKLVYLLGPMTGIPEFNFPAFKAAADELRARGFDVLSPAEMDEAEGFEPSPTGDDQAAEQYAQFLARDIQKIAEAGVDAGVALPGWERSGGANTEVAFLRALGRPILRYPDLEPIEVGRLVPDEQVHIPLRSGNPKDRLAQAQNKAPLDYLEPVAEEQIAWAIKNGADKYGIRNYVKESIRARVYVGAIKRHVDAWLRGEDLAPDSGLHHMAHVGANVHVILAAIEAGMFIDDRHGHEDDEREAAA